ncbi:hypothetical protein [Bradyrhizobium yuanmingense]|uniref:Restriction endonuclease type IV Mrr domain-containing protein n=1 Tax=Bradyrhizobium yuanmingense TaxID=108015 RepID=A0ABV4G732_9BRAD|nr:hypothetical protein [Bradyrhizobium yuanmingense]
MKIHVLSLGDPAPLFANQNLSDHVDAHVRDALAAVQGMNADTFLNTPTEDIISDLVEQHTITVPKLRRDDAYIDGPHEVDIRMSDYGREIRLRGTLLALIIPYDGEGGMFYVNPGRWGGAIRGNLHHNDLVLTVRGENLQANVVNTQFEARIGEIQDYLNAQQAMADAARNSLPNRLRPEIEARKKKLLDTRQMVTGLSFPIKARTDAPKTSTAPVTRRKIIATPAATVTPFAPEPVLDQANYEAILGIINSMALVMERSPSAFTTMGEESLRQHFLVQLNGHFEGAATGETFNFAGKTDILIRVTDRNIFIAECKFWSGEKAFIETINQLLGYLSWRDTKAAVIIFNRNRNFSGVLQTIQEAVPRHPHLKRSLPKRSETSFRYLFGMPADHNRELQLTVMAFDIPTS